MRLVHPFPSLLDAVATTVLALLAGGEVATALRLGAAMFLLQAAIGTLNDLCDVPRDAGHRPGKPIATGVVRPVEARVVLAVALTAGLALSAASGPVALGVALVGVGVGFAYDLRLTGTAWSWLPWSLGLPLLALFAWVGATGAVPGEFLPLLPAAALAGAALALANALDDLETDRRAGVTTVATALGARRTWLAGALLHLLVLGIALASLVAEAPSSATSPVPSPAGVAAIALGAGGVAAGLALARPGPSPRPRGGRLGWAIQALGVALVAAGWVALVAGPPAA